MSDEVNKASETVKDSVDKAADEVVPQDDKSKELDKEINKVAKDIQQGFEKAASSIKKEALVVGDSFKDPAVSSSVIVSIAAAAGVATYLNKQEKLDKLSVPVQLAIALGVAAVGVVNYYSVKAYKK